MLNKVLAAIGLLMFLAVAWQLAGSIRSEKLSIDPAFAKPKSTGPKTSTISHGEEVEISNHVQPSGRTLVMFTADWCGPCKTLRPQIEAIVEADEHMVLRKIDLSSRRMDVAQQYSVRGIPHLLLYEDGRLLANGTGEVMRSLGE